MSQDLVSPHLTGDQDSAHNYSSTDEDDTQDETEETIQQAEHLEDVPPGSQAEEDILKIIQDAYLDPNFTAKWKVAKIQMITAKNHRSDFEEKKQDLLIRGRKPSELQEQHGFLVENNLVGLELICSNGLQIHDSEYNALGYNRMGVYICKHSDVSLQHALVKYSGSPVIRMVLCKYVIGRYTTAIPRVASAAEFIEPTQGFDCHMSVIPPSINDSLQNKFDRSQVYIYEINKLLQPAPIPRQLMPYAVLHFTEDGIYDPIIDAEASAAEKVAENARLQSIVNAINSKDEMNGSESRENTPAATIPVITGGHIGSGPLSPVMGAPRPGLPLAVPQAPILLSPPSPAMMHGFDNPQHSQLRLAINQLTAKLEADERSKKAAGTDIIAAGGKPVMQMPPAPPGAGVRVPLPRVSPLGQRPAIPGVPMPRVPTPALAHAPNGALQYNPSVGAYIPGLPGSNPLGMLSPSLAGSAAHGSAAFRGPSQLSALGQGSALGQNGLVPVSSALPPGFTFPTNPNIRRATATSPGMPGAGILGSVPPTALSRSSPMLSMQSSRPLTPDYQSLGYIPNGTSSLSQTVLGAGSGLVVSSAHPAYASLHQSQFNPTYSIATGFPYLQSEQALTLPKETVKFDYPPGLGLAGTGLAGAGALPAGFGAGGLPAGFGAGSLPAGFGAGIHTSALAGGLYGAKDHKIPTMYYQAVQPGAAAYGQTMLVNQPMKRPLSDVSHSVEKRIKYY